MLFLDLFPNHANRHHKVVFSNNRQWLVVQAQCLERSCLFEGNIFRSILQLLGVLCPSSLERGSWGQIQWKRYDKCFILSIEFLLFILCKKLSSNCCLLSFIEKICLHQLLCSICFVLAGKLFLFCLNDISKLVWFWSYV